MTVCDYDDMYMFRIQFHLYRIQMLSLTFFEIVVQKIKCLISASSHSSGINYNAVDVKMTYPTTATKLVDLAIPGNELMCTVMCFSEPNCKASYIDNGGKCGLISNLELGTVSQASIKIYIPIKSK